LRSEGRQRVVPTDESSSLRVGKTVPPGRESNLSRHEHRHRYRHRHRHKHGL